MKLPVRRWGWAKCQMVKKVTQQYPIVEDGWKLEEAFTDAPFHTCRFTANSDEPIIYCYNKRREIAIRVPEQKLTPPSPPPQDQNEQNGGMEERSVIDASGTG